MKPATIIRGNRKALYARLDVIDRKIRRAKEMHLDIAAQHDKRLWWRLKKLKRRRSLLRYWLNENYKRAVSHVLIQSAQATMLRSVDTWVSGNVNWTNMERDCVSMGQWLVADPPPNSP